MNTPRTRRIFATLLAMAGLAGIGLMGGGLVGARIADAQGSIGWDALADTLGFIFGGMAVGALLGLLLGWRASPRLSATVGGVGLALTLLFFAFATLREQPTNPSPPLQERTTP